MVAKKPEKKSEPKAAAKAAEVPANVLHGVTLSGGDLKSGGTAKKPLLAVVPISAIEVLKGFNPRTTIAQADVENLANVIKADGLLEPLVVRPAKGKEGTFYIVNGEKRFRALKLNGAEVVPVSIRSDLMEDEAWSKAIALAENSDDTRGGLNPIEIGRACADLVSQHGWSPASVATSTGMHPQRVRRCLTLLEAPEDVQKQVSKNKLSLIAGLELAKLDDATRKAINSELAAKFEEADKSGEKVALSAQGVKAMAKAAAKAAGAVNTDGKSAKKKTGAARDVALAAWKGSRAKQQAIIDLAFTVHNATEEDKGTAEYFTTRGILIGLLWDRGDLDSFLLPDVATEDSAEKKVLKLFDEQVAAEAAKKKVEEAATPEATPAEAPAAKKGKAGK